MPAIASPHHVGCARNFTTPFLYRLVRHPLYLGFLLAFWGRPAMTAGGLLFAAAMTAYILIAVQLEERDLVHFHGRDYQRYKEQVPGIIPIPGRAFRGPGNGRAGQAS